MTTSNNNHYQRMIVLCSGVPIPECCTRIRTGNRIPKYPTVPYHNDFFERETNHMKKQIRASRPIAVSGFEPEIQYESIELRQATAAKRQNLCIRIRHLCPIAMSGFEPEDKVMNLICTIPWQPTGERMDILRTRMSECRVRIRTRRQNYESCPHLPRQPKPTTTTFILSGIPIPECCTRIRTGNRIPKYPTAPCHNDLFEREINHMKKQIRASRPIAVSGFEPEIQYESIELRQVTAAKRQNLCTRTGHFCPSAMFGVGPNDRRMNPARTTPWQPN